jgi:hypothetical protein
LCNLYFIPAFNSVYNTLLSKRQVYEKSQNENIRMKNKTDRFTQEELSSLKKELNSSYIIPVTTFLSVYFVIHALVYNGREILIIPKYELILIIGLLTITYFLRRGLTKSLTKEIQEGIKIIEYLPFAEKYNQIDKQNRFSKEHTKYVIIGENKKFVVTKEQFDRAESGDFIMIHKTPVRGRMLKIEIFKTRQPS